MDPRSVLAALPVWQGVPELTRLEQGRTNHNFIIRDGSATYFGRVGADLPHHGVSRPNERLCAELSASLGVSPRVHYASNGILITQFLDGETLRPADMHDLQTLRQTAELLQRLHAEPVTFPGLARRCGVSICLAYLEEVGDSELPVRRAKIVRRLGEPTAGGDRLVHSDLIPENLIRTTGGLKLIDWEYGGIGPPEIDLASVIANADLRPDEAAALLDSYGPHDPDLVERQRFALVVREALWCLTQMRQGGPEGDLVTYTQLCIERMSREFA
jgi:thiamine kinase-like enzyme